MTEQKTIAELVEDIQAEIGESSAESVDLTAYLSDAESCETLEDLRENLKAAEIAARVILDDVRDQLARIKRREHTPGPWSIESGDSVYSQADYAALSQRGHTAHALCTIHAIPFSKGDTDANARLIAAAPDLLKACRLMLDAVNEHHKDGSILWVSPGTTAWELLTDAIAKATGENL